MWSIVSSMKLLRKPSKRGEGDVDHRKSSKNDQQQQQQQQSSNNGNVKVERRESARLSSGASKFLRSLRSGGGNNSHSSSTNNTTATTTKDVENHHHPVNVIGLKEQQQLDSENIELDVKGQDKNPVFRLPERSQSFQEKRLLVVTSSKTSSELPTSNGGNGGGGAGSGLIKIKHSRAQSFVCNSQGHNNNNNVINGTPTGQGASSSSSSTLTTTTTTNPSSGGGSCAKLNVHLSGKLSENSSSSPSHHRLYISSKDKLQLRHGHNNNITASAAAAASATANACASTTASSTNARAIIPCDSIIYENLQVIREQKSNAAAAHYNFLNSIKNPIYSTITTNPNCNSPRKNLGGTSTTTTIPNSIENIYSNCTPPGPGGGENNLSRRSSRGDSLSSSSTIMPTYASSSSEKDRRSSRNSTKDSGYETTDYMTLDSIVSSSDGGSGESSPTSGSTNNNNNQNGHQNGGGSSSSRSNGTTTPSPIKSMSPHDKTIMKDIQRMSSKCGGNVQSIFSSNGGSHNNIHINGKDKGCSDTNNIIRLNHHHGSGGGSEGGRKLRRSISEVPSDRMTTVSKLQSKTMDNSRALYSSITNGLSIWNAEKSFKGDGRTYGLLQLHHHQQQQQHHQNHHQHPSNKNSGSVNSLNKNFPSASSTLPRRSSADYNNHHQLYSNNNNHNNHHHYQVITKSTPSLKNASDISLDTCPSTLLLNGNANGSPNGISSSSINSSNGVSGGSSGSVNLKKISRILPTISSARSTPNLQSNGSKPLSHTISNNNNNNNISNNCLNHIYDSPKLIQDQLLNHHNNTNNKRPTTTTTSSSSTSGGGIYSSINTNHQHNRQASFPTEKHPGLLNRMKNFENSSSNDNVYENSSRPLLQQSSPKSKTDTNTKTTNGHSKIISSSSQQQQQQQEKQEINQNSQSSTTPITNNNNNTSNNMQSSNGSSWAQNVADSVLSGGGGGGGSPSSGVAVRDSSSLKQIRYGPGHEKYPSWPIPVSSAAQIDPVGELTSHNNITNSGSSRSKSWTESTDYPKEKVPSYARPYMKRMNQSYTQQLKTVMEKCERIPPETFDKLSGSVVSGGGVGGQRQNINGSVGGSLGILPPPVGYRDMMYNNGNSYGNRLPKNNSENDNNMMMMRGSNNMNNNHNSDKEYNIPSPPERDRDSGVDQGKPFTQEDVELYAKKYEEMMNQYAHSEGYHSYISSECSSYISSGTPFLDQLRRESETNQQFWPGDVCDPNDPLFGLTSGRESVTTVVTNSSSNSSGTETLKWHGSTSDLSLTSGSGGGGGGSASLNLNPRIWEQHQQHQQQQQHHNNNHMPQKHHQQHHHHADSPHHNSNNVIVPQSQMNGGLRHIKNKLESQQTSLTKAAVSNNINNNSSNASSWAAAADGQTLNLKKFPLSTYTRPTTLPLNPDKQFTEQHHQQSEKNKLAGSVGQGGGPAPTNLSESNQTSPIVDTSKPPSVAERILELEQQSCSSLSSCSSQISPNISTTSSSSQSQSQTKAPTIPGSGSISSASSNGSTTTLTSTTNNHINGNHNEKFGKSSSLSNLRDKAQPQHPPTTSHTNNSKSPSQNKKDGSNTKQKILPESYIQQQQQQQQQLLQQQPSNLWNNFNESKNNTNNNNNNSTSSLLLRSTSTDSSMNNVINSNMSPTSSSNSSAATTGPSSLNNGSNSSSSSSNGPISYTYLDPDKKQKVSDMTLKQIQKKALLSYYERHTGKSSSSSNETSPRGSSSGSSGSQPQSSSSSSSVSTSSSSYNNNNNNNNKHESSSQVNNNNNSNSSSSSNLLEKDSPFPSNRLTLSLPRDIDRLKDHPHQTQAQPQQQQKQPHSTQQFDDAFNLRRETGGNRSSSDESSRSSHSSMTSSVAIKLSPTSSSSLLDSNNMDRGDCERHSLDDISSSNSARMAYISKYLPHLVHSRDREATSSVDHRITSPAPQPPERPPKKPHLRGVPQQTMDNGKNSCPPPPLPRAPVRQPAQVPSSCQSNSLDSLPPPVPTKPNAMMSIPRQSCQSPSDLDLPPPPPPVREEEVEVFNNDPLPPPPTLTEVHSLVGARSRSVSGLSSYLHKDSYLAQRKERTLGYEGRYRRTLSPSGLGSKSQTEVSTPHHHPMSNSTSTGKLDSTLTPSGWEKYHNIRAPSTTVIFTSNEIAKSTASSQPLFHRSISWESNLFNNKTGFSQSSIPPPVAQVAPLRGASNEVNRGSPPSSQQSTGTTSGGGGVVGVEEANNHYLPNSIEHGGICGSGNNGGGGGGGALLKNCASLSLKECDEEETNLMMMKKSGVVTGFVKRATTTKDSHCQSTESGGGMESSSISLTVSPLRFQSGLENKENIPVVSSGGVSNLKKSEISLRVNCLDASSQTESSSNSGSSSSNSSQCSSSSSGGGGKDDENEVDVMMPNEPSSFVSTLEDGEVLVKGLLVPSISSTPSPTSSATICGPPSSSSYTGRQKTYEELECELLSRDLAKQLPQGDKLQSLLVPLPEHKTPADYMEGLFPLELILRGDTTAAVTETTTKQNNNVKLSPVHSESNGTTNHNHHTNYIGSGSSSPVAAQVGSRHESDEESAAHKSAPLPADSAYFTTSECKAKFLTQYVNDMHNESISRSRTDGPELMKQKEELVSRISRKLEILRTEQLEIREEIQSNEHLGQIVVERVKQTAKRNEFDKFKLHVEEIEKITSLLLGLSGRLARAENALMILSTNNAANGHENGLMGLAENCNPQEKKILQSKRDKLKEQLDEAKILKENIDRRSAQVSGFLQKYLTAEEYADYHHFVKMKAKLIIDSREIDDKLKLGEEQMLALQETLSSSS